jgi:hypothetical protein
MDMITFTSEEGLLVLDPCHLARYACQHVRGRDHRLSLSVP